MIEMKCYHAIEEIKKILEEDTLNDAECFERIEKIIVIFEALGSGIHGRHDLDKSKSVSVRKPLFYKV